MKEPVQLCYTISEAAKVMEVEPHVLRYWEEEFSLETREFEFLMMGLRTFEGLNSARYRKNFRSVEPWNGDLEKRLEPVREFGVKTTENPDGSKNFSLTEDTILFLNKILLEL